MVGMFPNMADINRRTIKSPVNPLDMSTVFSILPIDIREEKVTISPSVFRVPKGTPDQPSLLHVEPASWWRELDHDQPLLEIPVSSIQVANAIVQDYCVGMLGVNGEQSKPGLFFLPGKLSVEDLKTKFSGTLIKAISAQNAWYTGLIKLADALWSRSNGNPLAISDLMRLAAKELGKNKEWIQDFQSVEQIRCKACGTFKSPLFPVCPNCKHIDNTEKAKELGIVFAA